jgi:hypothetical protein
LSGGISKGEIERRFNQQHRDMMGCIENLKGQIELLKHRMLTFEDEIRQRWR